MSTSNHATSQIIDAAWEARTALSPTNAPQDIRDAVQSVIDRLDKGEVRVDREN